MRIGFTGTRNGLTPEQTRRLRELLTGGEFHFGDCVGADAEAVQIAALRGMWLVVHPPLSIKHRAFLIGNEFREPKDYLKRNRDIVDECDRLIATPRLMVEELRSGTWATIRYCRKKAKPLTIVWPNGEVSQEPQ